MKYINNWAETKERLSALWQLKRMDRSCVNLTFRKDYAPAPTGNELSVMHPQNREQYMDPQINVDGYRRLFQNQIYLGEAFPHLWPNFGTAGHAKYAPACNFSFSPETIWYKPCIKEYTSSFCYYDPNSPLLKDDLDCVQKMCAMTMGEAMVGYPDNCGILDALAHLRGSDELMVDMLTEPEAVHDALNQLLDGFKHSASLFFDAIKENNEGGSVHAWMNTWCPGRHCQLEADISVMLSPDLYEEFIMPELRELTEWLDYSIYHFDGQEQIRHLDMILSLKRLGMIQWTAVVGQPPTSYFIPTLQKIQNAGKAVILTPDASEVPELVKHLAPEAVLYNVQGIKNEAHGKEILDYITKHTRR